MAPRRADGSLAAVSDGATQPALLRLTRVEPEWYRNARVFVTLPQLRPGWRGGVVQPAFNGVVTSAPPWAMDRLRDLYLLPTPPRSHAFNREADALDLFEDYHTPGTRLFFKTRNYHVFQRSGDAQRAYEELVGRYPQEPVRR